MAVVVALCSYSLTTWAQGADSAGVIQPGHEGEILSVVQPLPDGVEVTSVNIGARSFRFELLVRSTPLSVVVDFDAETAVTAIPAPDELPDEVRGIATELVGRIAQQADEAFWSRVLTWRPDAGGGSSAWPPNPGANARVPVALLLFATLASVLLIVASTIPRRVVSVLALAVAAAGPLGLIATGRLGMWDQATAPAYATVLCVLMVATVQLAWAVARAAWPLVRGRGRTHTADRVAGPLGLDATLVTDVGVVLAWSVLVRFGLATRNILTDGGSLRTRALDFVPDFGGMCVLLDSVLSRARQIDDVILVFTVLSALAPIGVVLIAHGLSLSRATRLLGGLALASWPVHAALFASDFESGPTLSLAAIGTGLLLIGLRDSTPSNVTLGAAITAFALWGRPEALVFGLPILAATLGSVRRWAREPRVLAGLVWLGLIAGLRVAMLSESVTGNVNPGDSLARTFVAFPRQVSWENFLSSTALVPPWLYLAPVGVVAAARRKPIAALVVALGLVAGVLPVVLSGAPNNFMRFLEAFRYGAFAMPWLAVGVGMALAWIASGLATTLTAHWPGPWHAVAVLTAAASLVAVPLVHRDYLAREYGPNVEFDVFVRMSDDVDPSCYIVVPDDLGESQGGGTIEIAGRFTVALSDAWISGRQTFPGSGIVRISEVLAALDAPEGAVVTSEGGATADLSTACWYFFWGTYCDDGISGVPPPSCRELLERVEHEPVLTHQFVYRHHRLVASPKHVEPPWFDPNRRLVLYRLNGVGDQGPVGGGP